MVLHPPKGALPVCSSCGAVLERQPLVKPVPFLVLLAVGSALIAMSLPGLLRPPAPPRAPMTQTTA